MIHPTVCVKAVLQTFAFHKNTKTPCGHATGGCYLLLFNDIFESIVSCQPNLSRQIHHLPSHYRSPGVRVTLLPYSEVICGIKM
jgi:hypothetical protein